MNTVTFGTYDSYEDLNLILTSKTIGAANVKTTTVDVPGADSELDYTEYFGEVYYKNRTLTFEFSTTINPSGFQDLYSEIQGLLHGKRMNIYLSDDDEYCYCGRVSVNEWKSNKRIGKIVIEVNANPYKNKRNITVLSASVTTSTLVNCMNLQKKVVPKITSTGEVTVAFGTYQRTFSGAINDPNILFREGSNVLTFTSTASVNVTVEYQEARL